MLLTADIYERFVHENLANYRDLFEVFGMSWPGIDHVALAEATHSVWVPEEFGMDLPGGYTEGQLREALPLLINMGIFEAQRPPQNGVPKILYVAGRKFPGMVASWEALEAVQQTGPVPLGIGAFGSRDRKPFDGSHSDLVDAATNADVLGVPWVERQFNLPVPFPTEHELGIFSALCFFGEQDIVLPHNDAPAGGLAYTLIKIRGVLFVVAGAAKEARHGYSRPKARGAATAAMDVVPLTGNEVFAITSGPPHTCRVAARHP